MIGGKINDRKSLFTAVAEALEEVMDMSDVFVDLTEQTVDILVPTEISGMSNKYLDGHELVWIEKITSHEEFEIMRDFAELCEGEEHEKLVRALSGRHPFRAFKDVLANEELYDNYYILHDKAYRELAESRLQDVDIDFVDGKIVCSEKSNISVFECEEDDA